MQIPFLSIATQKLGVACVSGKCRKEKKDCLFHKDRVSYIFFTISCKTGSSLALGISDVGELYKC